MRLGRGAPGFVDGRLPPSPVGWRPATDWFDIVVPLTAPSGEAAVVVWTGADWGYDCAVFQGDWYAMAIDEVRPLKP